MDIIYAFLSLFLVLYIRHIPHILSQIYMRMRNMHDFYYNGYGLWNIVMLYHLCVNIWGIFVLRSLMADILRGKKTEITSALTAAEGFHDKLILQPSCNRSP